MPSVGGVPGGRGPNAVGQFYVPASPWGLFMLTGITRDSAGAVLPACKVIVFRASDNAFWGTKVSDAGGNYSFAFLEPGPFFVYSVRARSTIDTTAVTTDSTAGTIDEMLEIAGGTADYLLAVRL